MSDVRAPQRVLILLGSPRKKGNSAELGRRIAEGAKKAGAETELVYLNGLNILPCQACYACRQDGAAGCAADDDMQYLYPKIRDADALVFAGPVYWFTVSAQTKLVMDRMFAFGGDDWRALIGKRAAVALTYGDEDVFASGGVNALRTFQDAFNYLKIELVGIVHGSAYEPGEINKNTALLLQAEELGRRLSA